MTPSGTDSALGADAAVPPAGPEADGAAREPVLFQLRIFIVAVGRFELRRRREQLAALSTAIHDWETTDGRRPSHV